MKDYSCELGAACGPEAAAGRELAAVRKRRCVAEEAQVAGEGDELLLLLFVRAVVRDDAHLFGYVGEARHLIASGRLGAADVLPLEHDDGRREPFRPMGLPAPLPLVMPL